MTSFWPGWVGWIFAATALAADTAPQPPDLTARIDASLKSAARFLVAQQAPDGAWYSQVYGALRDGPTLTPHVLSTLFYLRPTSQDAHVAFARGVDYLVGLAGDELVRTDDRGLKFPVYTAASASRVVVLAEKTPANLQAQAAWLACLRKRRLSSDLGWEPEDLEFGGWSFATAIPRKPTVDSFRSPTVASNLSATVFGIAALRSAKVPLTDPAFSEILLFVERCQNFSSDPARTDPDFDDGGFHFMPNDPVLNKTGPAGLDRFGQTRFHSYGSATADGLRALIRCGLAPDHPRVIAARTWLERHFSTTANPGTFAPDREVVRQSTYYYYGWAVAHAFLALDVRTIETETGSVNWAHALADELIARQQADGSWVSLFTAAKEDDPLVSTPFAAAALAICRQTMTGHEKAPAVVATDCRANHKEN